MTIFCRPSWHSPPYPSPLDRLLKLWPTLGNYIATFLFSNQVFSKLVSDDSLFINVICHWKLVTLAVDVTFAKSTNVNSSNDVISNLYLTITGCTCFGMMTSIFPKINWVTMKNVHITDVRIRKLTTLWGFLLFLNEYLQPWSDQYAILKYLTQFKFLKI